MRCFPRPLRWLILVLIFADLTHSVSAAPTLVTRGPYLQQSSTNTVVIRWRTSAATASALRYGTQRDKPGGGGRNENIRSGKDARQAREKARDRNLAQPNPPTCPAP